MRKITKVLVVLAVFTMLLSTTIYATSSAPLTPKTPIDINNPVEEIDKIDGEITNMIDTVDEIEEKELEDQIMDDIFGDTTSGLISTFEGQERTVQPDEDGIIRGDQYLFDENQVIIKDPVEGNLFINGTRVVIDCENVAGDIFVAGDDVVINADVSGNLFVVANKFSFNGGCLDLYLLGDTISLGADSYITRSARVYADKLIVSGYVGNDVHYSGDDLKITDTAKIMGNVTYSDSIEAAEEIKENASKEVSVVDETLEGLGAALTTVFKYVVIGFVLVVELIALGIIAIVAFASRRYFDENPKPDDFLKDTLLGLGYHVIIFAVIILSILTVVLIPMSITIISIWCLLGVLIKPVFEVAIANYVLGEKRKNTGLVILIAFAIDVVIKLLKLLPILTVKASLPFMLVFLGGIISIIVNSYALRLIYKVIFNKKKDEVAKV